MHRLSEMREKYCDPTHVILVDEFDVVRNIIKKQLEHRGFRVTGLSSGLALVQYYTDLVQQEATAYPVILIERRLTGLDGLTATKIVKQMCPWVKAILFTSDHLTPKAASVMDYVLTKPVSCQEIEDALFEVVDVIC
jgi:CheY-like chemotaxis protein